jgi:hypothetical protein
MAYFYGSLAVLGWIWTALVLAAAVIAYTRHSMTRSK